jgi:hypothetical protein
LIAPLYVVGSAVDGSLRSNWMLIEVEPSELVDVIWRRRESARTGVPEAARPTKAMVSGLAPGRLAEIWMVGKSTCGSGATGSSG